MIDDIILLPESTPTPVARKEPKLRVTPKQWKMICSKTLEEANFICEICKNIDDEGSIQAHEAWDYDDEDNVATLIGMMALCSKCHLCKHIGTANKYASSDILIEHLSVINGIDKEEAEKLFNKAIRLMQKRNSAEWIVDLTHLKEYGLDVSQHKQKQT